MPLDRLAGRSLNGCSTIGWSLLHIGDLAARPQPENGLARQMNSVTSPSLLRSIPREVERGGEHSCKVNGLWRVVSAEAQRWIPQRDQNALSNHQVVDETNAQQHWLRDPRSKGWDL